MAYKLGGWKCFSLITLTLQNAVAMISVRYSRSRSGDIAPASTVVIATEVLKLVISLFLALKEEGNLRLFLKSLQFHVIGNPLSTLAVSVPAVAYLVQNNLLFLAATHLNASTYHVAYQSKIFTTAIFSIFLLKKRIRLTQWVALSFLMTGIVLVQLAAPGKRKENENPLIGVTAAFGAALCSGFAGVYFEKIVKESNQGTMWIRNVQLALASVIIGIVSLLFGIDRDLLSQNGLLFGFDWFVLYLIIIQGSGGLLVAMVIKYADNILKGFAFCLSIVLSSTFSVIFFEFVLTTQFVVGVIFVMTSIFLYNSTSSIGSLFMRKKD